MAPTRYLTAQRISLLVLVNLYFSSTLPSSATIPVLSFIISNSIPAVTSSARARRASEQYDASFSVRAFEDVLQGHPSNMPGRTLLDSFLKEMWAVNSFDALHDLFDNLEELLIGVDGDGMLLLKASPVAVFIRRARLEFTNLQLDDALKLWSSFINFRAPTAQWTKRLAGLASSGVDFIASEMGLQPGDELYEMAYGHLEEDDEKRDNYSLNDLERLLDFQLDRLQRLGCRVPDDMKDQLRDMLGPSGSMLRQAHLVKFFDSWKAGDYTSAFDNLHRYYDYATQTREKIHYQYALLHMAILQADFGCFGEAIAAINETIAAARENQDMTCLSFSLSWLNHMSKAYPRQMKGAGYMSMLGSERDGLIFLKAKAKETKMYNLLSSTLLNEAKLCLATGLPISKALEYVYQSSHLNIRDNINNYGSQMLLLSSLYSRLGIPHLARVHSDLLLDCYHHGCPIDERVRAITRHAFIVSKSGRYEEALAYLDSVDASVHRSLKFHQYLVHCIGLIKVRLAIRRTDWLACESLISSLTPDSSTDPEVTYLLSEARIDYLASRGSYPEAFQLVENLSATLREEGADIFQRISVLLAKADIYKRAGKPERGFSVALRAANMAFKARLMPCLWTAIGCLSHILNSVGEYAAATRLLQAVLPQSLENADHMLCGTLYSHIGDSYIGLAGQDDPSSSYDGRLRAANISRAELYIDRARECYKKVENIEGECEQIMKKALIAKLRGDEKLAEEWAQNYNRVWDEGMQRIVDGSSMN